MKSEIPDIFRHVQIELLNQRHFQWYTWKKENLRPLYTSTLYSVYVLRNMKKINVEDDSWITVLTSPCPPPHSVLCIKAAGRYVHVPCPISQTFKLSERYKIDHLINFINFPTDQNKILVSTWAVISVMANDIKVKWGLIATGDWLERYSPPSIQGQTSLEYFFEKKITEII